MSLSDRRVRKTKAVLRGSLIQLMKVKSINSITVKELCDVSDINRGTFYLHYKDIFDMIDQIEEEMFQSFKSLLLSHEISKENIETKAILKDIFTFIYQNKDFCMVLLNDNGQISFIKRIISVIYNKSSLDWSKIFGNQNKNLFDKYYSFILYGSIGLIENWLETGTKETPEEMAILTERIILNGLSYIKNL